MRRRHLLQGALDHTMLRPADGRLLLARLARHLRDANESPGRPAHAPAHFNGHDVLLEEVLYTRITRPLVADLSPGAKRS